MTESVPFRLGVYGVGLVLAFLAALGVGAAVGPVGPAATAGSGADTEDTRGTTTGGEDDHEPSGEH